MTHELRSLALGIWGACFNVRIQIADHPALDHAQPALQGRMRAAKSAATVAPSIGSSTRWLSGLSRSTRTWLQTSTMITTSDVVARPARRYPQPIGAARA